MLSRDRNLPSPSDYCYSKTDVVGAYKKQLGGYCSATKATSPIVLYLGSLLAVEG